MFIYSVINKEKERDEEEEKEKEKKEFQIGKKMCIPQLLY